MIDLRPLRTRLGAPLDASGGQHSCAAIMALGEGFARDGIGACWLGFEIFVRWTSLEERFNSIDLVGPDFVECADIT